MRRVFRSFEKAGVRYLLISGQASVVYGAASFSEDIDVWVEPSTGNVQRLLRSLAALRARVYKLTPPLTQRHVRRGHGFHFLAPSREGDIYLDVMGRPPRVGSFASAFRRRRTLPTFLGRIPVVGIEDLVELKKTRRLADYEVISTLVAIRVREEARPGRRLLAWAARNSFRAEDRSLYLRKLGHTVSAELCTAKLLADLQRLQAADQAYWRPILDELRGLRDRGALLEAGAPVAGLVRRNH